MKEEGMNERDRKSGPTDKKKKREQKKMSRDREECMPQLDRACKRPELHHENGEYQGTAGMEKGERSERDGGGRKESTKENEEMNEKQRGRSSEKGLKLLDHEHKSHRTNRKGEEARKKKKKKAEKKRNERMTVVSGLEWRGRRKESAEKRASMPC